MTGIKIFIDPSVNVLYSSYYLEGFYSLAGKRNVHFSAKYFQSLDRRGDDWSYDSYMSVVMINNGEVHKVTIDFGDDFPIRKNAYQWCDIYAKINYCPEKSGIFEKVVSIPPSFGIKIWNWWEIVFFSISNFIKMNFKPQASFFSYFRGYFSQIKLLKIENFTSTHNLERKENYIFSISSLWPHENCLVGTNMLRKTFMEASQNSGAEFEGGFFLTDKSHPQVKDFEHFILKKRYPLKEFIKKTKQSALVFNTPAVHNCHGWKLGQYLAMGKAVISTPPQNKLPENYEHGENIEFVDNEGDIEKSIDKILNDDVYRKKLEEGSRRYYETFASPSSCINIICKQLKII